MISFLGDGDGNAPGGFLLLDENFEIAGKWSEKSEIERLGFSYDFWYQPYHNVMVSSEWAAPNTFLSGFNPAHVAEAKYGRKIYFWDWSQAKIIKEHDLGPEGLIPLGKSNSFCKCFQNEYDIKDFCERCLKSFI